MMCKSGHLESKSKSTLCLESKSTPIFLEVFLQLQQKALNLDLNPSPDLDLNITDTKSLTDMWYSHPLFTATHRTTCSSSDTQTDRPDCFSTLTADGEGKNRVAHSNISCFLLQITFLKDNWKSLFL